MQVQREGQQGQGRGQQQVRVRVVGETTRFTVELAGLSKQQRQEARRSLETVAAVLALRFGRPRG